MVMVCFSMLYATNTLLQPPPKGGALEVFVRQGDQHHIIPAYQVLFVPGTIILYLVLYDSSSSSMIPVSIILKDNTQAQCCSYVVLRMWLCNISFCAALSTQHALRSPELLVLVLVCHRATAALLLISRFKMLMCSWFLSCVLPKVHFVTALRHPYNGPNFNEILRSIINHQSRTPSGRDCWCRIFLQRPDHDDSVVATDWWTERHCNDCSPVLESIYCQAASRFFLSLKTIYCWILVVACVTCDRNCRVLPSFMLSSSSSSLD